MEIVRAIGDLVVFLFLVFMFRHLAGGESSATLKQRARIPLVLVGAAVGGLLGFTLVKEGGGAMGLVVALLIGGGVAWEVFFGTWRRKD